MRKPYPTDLSDAEWSCLKPHLPTPKATGRPRLYSTREILDAVFYVLRSGCPWRLLPHDFPPWKADFRYFRAWRIGGTWERMNRPIRERLRARIGRKPEPSAGIMDSQSAKTTGVGGEEGDYDDGKKLRGRKRHLLVDPLCSVLDALALAIHHAACQHMLATLDIRRIPQMAGLAVVWRLLACSELPVHVLVLTLRPSHYSDDHNA